MKNKYISRYFKYSHPLFTKVIHAIKMIDNQSTDTAYSVFFLLVDIFALFPTPPPGAVTRSQDNNKNSKYKGAPYNSIPSWQVLPEVIFVFEITHSEYDACRFSYVDLKYKEFDLL